MKKFLFLLIGIKFLFASLIIGIPGGYKKVFPPIVKLYDKTYNTHIKVVYAPLGFLISQAKLGTLDVIMGEKSILKKYGFKTFYKAGTGKLVILSRNKINNMKDIDKFQKLALPNPDSTMYGKVAKEAFDNADISPKTLIVALMPQGINYLMLGECDAAVANLTQAMLLKKKFFYYVVPENLYKPLLLGFTIVKKSSDSEKFIYFIKNKQTLKLFKKMGL